MAKTNYQTIDAYHGTFSGDTLTRMEAIRQLVHAVAPEAEEVISYQIPAFKIGTKFLLYYSAYSKHISLASPWSVAFLKEFEKELKEYTVTKSAIQLPLDNPFPTELIRRMIRFRKAEVLGD